MISSIAESELIVNPNGSIYHLNLKPGDLAETIITVGDPDRVPLVSQYFDEIELTAHKREIVTHTGYLNKQRISVISTGMGTGCIDIVLNEIDALFNIDFATRQVKPQPTALKIVRIGTSGSLQAHVPVDSYVVSQHALGLDNLLHFYNIHYNAAELKLLNAFIEHLNQSNINLNPYVTTGAASLTQLLSADCIPGITATCTGFYGPQGRILRAQPVMGNLISVLQQFQHEQHYVTNFEMETAAIYGLGSYLGHECCSVSAIIANRAAQQFSKDPHATVDKLIQIVLEKLTATVALEQAVN